ncbi:MAG TPA: hypothetical protein DCM05_17680 [Elusimicrobia bacterium]|nr:hypothetical protein [Elusimicrobiota bacterium]
MPSFGHGTLYRFHQELGRPVSGTQELLSRALGLMAPLLRAERLSVLSCRRAERSLRLALCRERGRLVGRDETLVLGPDAPLWQLVEGRRRRLCFAKPRPLLYVPLRWEGGCWVLRVERFARRPLRLPSACGGGREEDGRARPFTARERVLARLLGEELARSLRQTLKAEQNRSLLGRLMELTDMTAVFAGSLRVEHGLRVIAQGVARRFGLDRVRLYLVDSASGVLRGEVSVDVRGRALSLRSEELPLDEGEEEGGLRKDLFEDRALAVPLVVKGQRIGLLVADNLLSQQTLPSADAALLKTYAGQIALAVDNARLFEEVQALSLYDALTGLPVRRFFTQRFQEELYRSERSGQPVSVAMLDIDRFKAVNDTYGHQTGDAVLREVGCAISRNLRKLDFSARYGGDELLVLLPQAGPEEAVSIMSRLLQEIRRIRVPVEFSKAGWVGASASIGLASYPHDGRTVDDLVRKADEALYWVKSHGRDGLADTRIILNNPQGNLL